MFIEFERKLRIDEATYIKTNRWELYRIYLLKYIKVSSKNPKNYK